MKTKQLFFIAFLSAVLVSCKQEEKNPNLDNIWTIYCTPKEFGKCLPLEINNSFEGWKARYIGAPSKGLLSLEPCYEVNNAGDSIVVFKEFINDGKPNGKYILHRSSMFENEYDGISYINSSGKDTTDFYTNIIQDGTVFTFNSNIKESIRKTMEFEGNDPIGHGSERRDLNMSYLIHSNPEALHKSFKVEDLEIKDSPDGKLRIYTFVGYTGGNGVGSSYDVGILQYEAGNGEVAVLDHFTTLLYTSLVDFSGANFAYCSVNSIRTAKIGKNTYYLIEALFNDARPRSLDGSNEFLKEFDTVLYAFTIQKGKLTPARIFDNEWKIEVIGSQETPELHYGYDDVTKTVSAPIVEGNAHLFKGKYKNIKLQ